MEFVDHLVAGLIISTSGVILGYILNNNHKKTTKSTSKTHIIYRCKRTGKFVSFEAYMRRPNEITVEIIESE